MTKVRLLFIYTLSTKFEISLILSAVILYGIFSIYLSSVLTYFPKMLYSKVSVIE